MPAPAPPPAVPATSPVGAALPRCAFAPVTLAAALGLLLSASTARAGTLEIEWRSPVGPVQGFVIERRPEFGSERSLVARLGPEARAFIDDTVPAGGTFCYSVRAILGDGSWAPSPERCATALTTPRVETIDVAAPPPAPDATGDEAPATPGAAPQPD